jgi:hypothetical protein
VTKGVEPLSFIEVTVGTVPTRVCSVPPGGVTVQNTGLEQVFLGGPAVSAFSEPLSAGASTTISGNWLVDVLLLAGSELYAITATATTTLMVQNATPMPRPRWPHPSRPHQR